MAYLQNILKEIWQKYIIAVTMYFILSIKKKRYFKKLNWKN